MTTAYAVALKETLSETSVALGTSGWKWRSVCRSSSTAKNAPSASQCTTDFQAKMVAGLLQLLT